MRMYLHDATSIVASTYLPLIGVSFHCAQRVNDATGVPQSYFNMSFTRSLGACSMGRARLLLFVCYAIPGVLCALLHLWVC